MKIWPCNVSHKRHWKWTREIVREKFVSKQFDICKKKRTYCDSSSHCRNHSNHLSKKKSIVINFELSDIYSSLYMSVLFSCFSCFNWLLHSAIVAADTLIVCSYTCYLCIYLCMFRCLGYSGNRTKRTRRIQIFSILLAVELLFSFFIFSLCWNKCGIQSRVEIELQLMIMLRVRKSQRVSFVQQQQQQQQRTSGGLKWK